MFFGAALVPAASLGEARSNNEDWRYKFEVSAFQTDSANVDGGGQTDVTTYQLQAGAKRKLRPSVSLGAGFSYSHHERRFTGAGDFASLRPWGDTTRLEVSTSVIVHASELWSIGLRPFFNTFSETGNIESDSVSYGTALAGILRLADDRHLGVGARLSDSIDGGLDLSPVLVFEWRFNDQWLLSNPSEPDALGSAGLELVHVPADNWQLGLGGVYQSAKFLLDDQGVAPGGIGEHEALIVFARVGRKWSSGLTLKGYLGAAFEGTLTVQRADGTTLAQSDYDTTPLAGVSVEASF